MPKRDGKWTKQVLWTFNGLDGTSGANALTMDWAGNIYGMTNQGGPAQSIVPGKSDDWLVGGVWRGVRAFAAS